MKSLVQYINESKSTKHIIWSSDIDEKDWKAEYEEACEDGEVDPEKTSLYDWAYELNQDYLGDEKQNLNVDCNTIIAVGNLGRWNGRGTSVHKVGDNVSDIFKVAERSSSYMDYEWYAENGEVVGCMKHHDGSDYYYFRELKDNVDLEDFEEEITKDNWKEMIDKYTQSLFPRVAKVYGWK